MGVHCISILGDNLNGSIQGFRLRMKMRGRGRGRRGSRSKGARWFLGVYTSMSMTSFLLPFFSIYWFVSLAVFFYLFLEPFGGL